MQKMRGQSQSTHQSQRHRWSELQRVHSSGAILQRMDTACTAVLKKWFWITGRVVAVEMVDCSVAEGALGTDASFIHGFKEESNECS